MIDMTRIAPTMPNEDLVSAENARFEKAIQNMLKYELDVLIDDTACEMQELLAELIILNRTRCKGFAMDEIYNRIEIALLMAAKNRVSEK